MILQILQTKSILNPHEVLWKQKQNSWFKENWKFRQFNQFECFMKCLMEIIYIQFVDNMYELMWKPCFYQFVASFLGLRPF